MRFFVSFFFFLVHLAECPMGLSPVFTPLPFLLLAFCGFPSAVSPGGSLSVHFCNVSIYPNVASVSVNRLSLLSDTVKLQRFG